MGFTRDQSSLIDYIEDGVPVNNPDFVSWDADSVAAGMDWGLGNDWSLNVNADGTALTFEHGSTIPLTINNDGELSFDSLEMASIKLTILNSLPDVTLYQLGEVVNVLGFLYIKQEDPS